MLYDMVFTFIICSLIHYHALDNIEQTLAAARMLTPSGSVGQTHWSDSTANNAAPATHSADAQLKVQLCLLLVVIFFSLLPFTPFIPPVSKSGLDVCYNSKNLLQYLRKLATSRLAPLVCTSFIA